MQWIDPEPLSVAQRELNIEDWNNQWDRGEDFMLGVYIEGTQVGGTGLHLRTDTGSPHIGYWVRSGYGGRGIATAAARALTTAAFAMDAITSVEIHHDVANVISGLIPKKLGYEQYWTGPTAIEAPGESGITNKWRMYQDNWKP